LLTTWLHGVVATALGKSTFLSYSN
jgi:hypothetical protein